MAQWSQKLLVSIRVWITRVGRPTNRCVVVTGEERRPSGKDEHSHTGGLKLQVICAQQQVVIVPCILPRWCHLVQR